MRLKLILVIALALTIASLPIFIKSSHPGEPPTASFTYSPPIPGPGSVITFDASASFSPGGSITSYTWDFGDGTVTTTTNPTITYSYPIDGNYTVQLTITDNNGMTGTAVAVIQVQKDISFRVVVANTVVPLANAQVTIYYKSGTTWVPVPARSANPGVYMEYDNMTQPKEANQYTNPAYTASILLNNASNIQFDIHPSSTVVFFKIQWGSQTAYWPNDTNTYYTYDKNRGTAVAQSFEPGEKPYWDPDASTYVISAVNIHGGEPSECNPIIAGVLCPPPTQQWSLTVKTDPLGITTIPGQGLYANGTNVVLTAPAYVNVSTSTRYRFNYWDVDGTSRGSVVNPITVLMAANHTATAHYITQYYLTVSSAYDSPTPISGWFDSGTSITASVTSPVSGSSGTQYVCTGWTGTGSAPASGASLSTSFIIAQPSSITWNWKTQYYLTVTSAHGTTGGQGWYDSGTTAYATVTPLTVAGSSGTQYVFTQWSGDAVGNTSPSNAIVMNGAKTATANWKTQYYLTVTSAYGTVGGQGWYDSGSTAYASVSPLVVAGPSGTQYVFTSWSGDASGSTSPSNSITMSGPKTGVAGWKTQYYLTVTSAYGIVGGQGWYDSGSTAYASVSPLTVSGGSGVQYVFTSWSGDASGSTSPSNAITISGPKTATAGWKTQYYLTVSSARDSPTPVSGWFDSGTGMTASVTSPAAGSAGTQYVCIGWTGTGSVPGSGSGTSVTFTIVQPSSITWNWKTQYYLTVTSAHGTTGGQGWYDSGTTAYATVTPLTVAGSSGTQYVFTQWSGDAVGNTSPSNAITMNGPKTATAGWKTQYYLTVSSAYGAVGGQGWYDSGSTAYATVSPLTVSGGSGVQYVFTSWSGDASGNTSPSNVIVMNGPKTATAGWKTQYYLTVSSAYGSPTPVSGWFDSGTGMTASVTSPAAGSAGTQYVCTGWTGTGSAPGSGGSSTVTFTINAPSSITWNWKTQYQVIFDQTGVGSDFTGTVVTIDGVNYSRSGLPTTPQFWWDQGSSHSFYFTSPLTVNGGTNYVWNSTSGLSSLQSGTLTITTSGNVIGNYIVQNRITFDQTGVGSDFTGTVVIIDGVNYARSQLPVSFPWTNSSVHTFAYQSPLVPSANTQYVWASTSGISNLQSGSITVTTYGSIVGNYKTQYYLTVSSAYGTTGGQGWYDSGSTAYATVSPLTVAGPTGIQYVFTSWSGDAGGNTSPSNAITMNGPKTATAGWKIQYYLTVSSAYGTIGGQGWYDSGSTAYATVSPLTVAGPTGIQYVFTSWSGDAGGNTSPSNAITMNGPKTATAGWKTQYYLTIASPYDSPTPSSGWFDSGASITASVTSPAAGPSGTQYVCTGWTGTGNVPVSGSGTSVTFTIVQPSSITWNWKTQYYLTVTSAYGTVGGQGWYDSGTTAYATVSPLTVAGPTGIQYVFTSWSGDASGNTSPSNPIVMSGPSTATANWKTQYYLTVSSVYGSTGGQGWYDSGTTAYATVTPLTVAGPSGTQYVFTQWSGDAGGNTSPSNAITMNGPKTATAGWKTQYYLTVSSAYGAVGGQGWYDSGTTAYATVSPLTVSGGSGVQYVFTSWSGDASGNTSPSNPIVMSGPSTATANWKTQYYLTVSSVYGSTGGQGWYDSGATAYATVTPLSVLGPSGTQYAFDYWSGDASGSTSPSNAITMSGPMNAVANWKIQYYLTVSSAYGTIGGQGWYDSGSTAYASVSPLTVSGGSGVQYVFTQWTGDASGSTSPSSPIVMSGPMNAVANWKTQYYLTLATDPLGVTSPLGAGWYDAGSNAAISTPAFVDITPGSSRYRFNGWTTSNITEITDPTRSPTTVLMDEAKTVTVTYVVQYYVTFSQTGVGSDFTNTIVTVDSGQHNITDLPYSTWWDNASVHTFAYQSPLIVTQYAKQYVWASTTGLSSSQTGSLTVATSGNVIGNYETQYYLTVNSLYDSPSPGSGWLDSGTTINANVASLTTGSPGTRYVCTGWTGAGSVPPSGSGTSVSFTITQNSSLTWNWKTQYYLTVQTDPNGVATIAGTGWYDGMASVSLTAPTVQNYTFNYWDVDGPSQGNGVNPINVMMIEAHTATAHYFGIPGLPLNVSISPAIATIPLGGSVTFTSTVNGGTSPYSYQWFLGSTAVAGATSSTWTFNPTAPGTYFVYLQVTDAANNTASSTLARIMVPSGPVGGYSISFAKPAQTTPAIAYFAIVALFGLAISLKKRKRK
jgi:hypothetical protein